MTTQVYLVAVATGQRVGDLTVDALDVLRSVDLVLYPGDWLGQELRDLLGERLRAGRDLDWADALADLRKTCAEGGRVAVLYSGDGLLYSGEPGLFPASGVLATSLRSEGLRVRLLPGLSSVQLALARAGWHLPADSGRTLWIGAPGVASEGAEPAIARLPHRDDLLALLLSETKLVQIATELRKDRSGETPVVVARALGSSDEQIVHTTLAEVADVAAPVSPPAVILVGEDPLPMLPDGPKPTSVGATTPEGRTRTSARRPIAAVLGAASPSEGEASVAEALGRALVDRGFRVLSGGLGGAMAAASRGARSSTRYVDGDVIGIVPTYDASTANPDADVVICTGLGFARNILVVASADVVLAVGGRSGTLNEISLAWSLGKPIVAVGATGWGGRLAGQQVDDRRDDHIVGPLEPEAAAEEALRLLAEDRSPPREFQ